MTLVLAGPNPERQDVSGIEGILDLGIVDDQGKQDALAACDILCVPSEGESFGMVYYEAWVYGKPVIARDLPTLRESIGSVKGGILVDGSTDSLVNAMSTLLPNEELRVRMGMHGKAHASSHQWSNAIESYIQIYNEAQRNHSLDK